MFIYRLAIVADESLYQRHIALGGRWHLPGVACFYGADSIAQAMVEYSIHHSYKLLAVKTQVIRYELPRELVGNVEIHELPEYPSNGVSNRKCRYFGSNLIQTSGKLAIGFPSLLVPGGRLYAINPVHSAMKSVNVDVVCELNPIREGD